MLTYVHYIYKEVNDNSLFVSGLFIIFCLYTPIFAWGSWRDSLFVCKIPERKTTRVSKKKKKIQNPIIVRKSRI